jgi:4-hydroxybenzoate polyprenyltransferase
MSQGAAIAVLLAAVALFISACAALSPLCLKLCPLALLIVLGYSYTKRVTWASHLFLGLALAVAPVGAWIAVGGGASWIPVLLACAVLLWTAGFDIIYSCQDVGFDRGAGLHSIPARFGVTRALHLSTVLHALMIAALIGMGMLAGLGAIYFAGVAVTAGALIYEHRIVKPDDLSRVNVAFFTMNGWISVTLFVATVLDLFI